MLVDMSWLFWYCVVSHCLFSFFLYKITEDIDSSLSWPRGKQNNSYQQKVPNKNDEKKDLNTTMSMAQGSSVWCFGQQKIDRICKFRNLCYSSVLEEYLFFHGHSTIVEGVPDKRCSPALLDLSSVDDHNLQYFNYLDVPSIALQQFSNITVMKHPSLLFHRFNPDNLMHVIHDDLLPLFYTLIQHFPDFQNASKPFNSQVQLVFMEGRQEGPFFNLYKIFSQRTPIIRPLLSNNQSLICFKEVLVGISKATTWYDYGFKIPQSTKKNHTSNSKIIHHFAQYVREKLATTKSDPVKSEYVIIFSREINRLILNEFELIFKITTTFQLKVIRLSLETNTIHEIIQNVQNAAGLIGMHGSILSLAIFLPPGSFMIELFPYAVNPENYTPYKTLAQISGMDISYGSWANKIKNNTVVHPNRSKNEGGIAHLNSEEQEHIFSAEIIPKHLCCDNPHWLFRIYQDTVVDIKSFVQVMRKTLDGRQISNNNSSTNIYKPYPGKIKSVHCNGLQMSNGPGILVAWQPSWNTQFFGAQDIEYEIWIQNQTSQKYSAYVLETVTEYIFMADIKYNTSYSIWVRGVLLGNIGPFSDVCICMTHYKHQ